MKPIEILIKFVEGKLSSAAFETELYQNKELEDLLNNEHVMTQEMSIEGFTTPYYYFISQNFNDAGARLNVHDICKKILTASGIQFQSTGQYKDFYNLILTTQPKYLDLDGPFFEKQIYKAEYKMLSKTELKKTIKQRINALFQFDTKVPKWIQNPEWIIEDDKPLIFLEAYTI